MKKPSIDPQTLARAAEVLRVIAHPARLNVIELLRTRKRSVGELVEELGLPQAMVSKHLALLRKVGLLACETDCNFRYYFLANSQVLDVLNCIKKSCSKGAS